MYYVPLHVHSDASLDGAGTVQSLVAEAKRLGMGALALTDHGTLANAVAFWSACTEAEIKPILGMEAYLMYHGKRHHITLLTLNEGGFNGLVHLDSKAHRTGYSGGYPLVTMDDLEQYKEGVFALTGCASSALFEGSHEDAKTYVGDLLDIYGRDRVALETMFVGSFDTWSRPLQLAKEMTLRYVVTNDTHYPCQNQFHAHQTVCSARRGFTYNSEHLWLKSGEEILLEGNKWTNFDLIMKGLTTTNWVADQVESWSMAAPPSLPHIPDVEFQLTRMLREGLKKDVENKGQQKLRLERLRMEFRILKEKQFLDYIYILSDIVDWAKAQDIMVGPGRGSGGGSYVLYLLGITGIDPLEHNLLFERFINPARNDYPDVDVDFEADRRHLVLEYADKEWGTIPIATYSCYSHKSAVHDIARVLKIPKDLEVPAADSEVDSDAFTTFINQHEDALVTYNTMLGQIRHRGKHAAGVIMPNRPVPVERAGDDLVAAWAEGMNTKDLSKVGIVKYDLLGLTALSQLKAMDRMTDCVPPQDGYLDDPKVYDLFCEGDVAGIFQWSGSDGIRELTKRIAPRNFYDLTTCNALYRPGALDAGTADHYPEYMKKPRLLDPRIDPILAKTYGVICYQEQVMSLVAEVMGGDLAQADLTRRLISKADIGNPKWEHQISDLQAGFILVGMERGYERRLLEQLWHEIYTHSGYSYNLAHATAYTLVSYQMAWYKVYHRSAFTASVLQYDKANAQTYILDAVSHGLEVSMPHVNVSTNQYELMDNTIFIPLNDIAFLGEKGADYLIEERLRNGPFASYEDFNRRVPKKVCNNRARTLMERVGAFARLEGDPSAAIKDYASIPVEGEYQTQLEVLGYVVPTKELYARMEALASRPVSKGKTRFAGFVSSGKKKKSVHGEYTVYNLSPFGSFWIRESEPSLEVGMFVSGTKSTFGHSTDVKRYRL